MRAPKTSMKGSPAAKLLAAHRLTTTGGGNMRVARLFYSFIGVWSSRLCGRFWATPEMDEGRRGWRRGRCGGEMGSRRRGKAGRNDKRWGKERTDERKEKNYGDEKIVGGGKEERKGENYGEKDWERGGGGKDRRKDKSWMKERKDEKVKERR